MRTNVFVADKDQQGFDAIMKAAHVSALIECYAKEVVQLLDSDKDLPLYIFDKSNDKVYRIRYCIGLMSRLICILKSSPIVNH